MEITQTAYKTKKKKKAVMLPALRNYIVQPNRVTNAVYDYSLIQERLLNAVMFYLQGAIRSHLSGEDYRQLSLFKDSSRTDTFSLKIPLKEISSPQNYDYVKDSVKKLASVLVEIPYVDNNTKREMLRYTGLIRANVPKKHERSSYIEVEIERGVAKLLIEVDLNESRKPINYTRFVYEIAQNASSKYTSRIYKLISSWKQKGGFVMSLDEFRKWLGIEDKYKYYNDIRKHILVPVQAELFEKADCWFNCNTSDFVIKEGNTVTRLNFKVITPDLILEEAKKIDYVRHLLRTHFYFLDKDIDAIKPILTGSNIQPITTKLIFLKDYIMDNKTKITDVPRYVIKTLMNEFAPEQN